ncbi:Lar family restriction alleviation protein [Pseudomonas sp. NPDC088444]|uniref:Lar family restriction alleviation protein n=1 Tax=Pseudomonas sp. NPDC088444 TaxID=3364456 RepID=UPI00384C3427
MSQELKPCPFCGGTNLQVTEASSYVMCYGCDADGPVGRPADAAIAAWNNRAAPVPPAGGEPNLNRTQEQWRLVDAKLCAKQNSEAANEFLILDAQYDIAILGSYVTRLQAEVAALQARLTVADQRVDDLGSKAKLYDQLQNGAELLPNGWVITIKIERDGGGVTLIDPQGNDIDYPSNRESMGDEIEDAIEEALALQGES